MNLCPCGSQRDRDDCCGPIIANFAAPTPEALMRSRYTAFVQKNIDYIDQTHAPEIRADFNRAEAERSAAEIEWLGLEVLSSSENGDWGTVEFIIHFRRAGKKLTQYELSSFRREAGQWLYVKGEINKNSPPRHFIKIGRNDPCPCGSGKKYKKCCSP